VFSPVCLSFFTGKCKYTKLLNPNAIRTNGLNLILRTSVCPHLQRQPQHLDHFQDGGELGVAVGAQRAVQALAAQAGVFGQLHHAACAGYHAQGVLRQGGVDCLQAFLKVLLHVVRGLQGGGAVVALDAEGFARNPWITLRQIRA
jgi:hypothetical protein